jgi:hypothetical protein
VRGWLRRRFGGPGFRIVLRAICYQKVIPGYTGDVKTAISLPDATFERATEKSKELGISRSEFFARAAEVYLDQLAGHSLTRQIDEALETAGTDESRPVAVSAGRRRLAEDDW